eukprot:532499_1
MTTALATALNILKREKIKLGIGIGISIIGVSVLAKYILSQSKRFKYDINNFTRSITNDLCNFQIKQRNTILNPAPYSNDSMKLVGLNCIATSQSKRHQYSILAVDEHFGDLGSFENIFFYGKYSNGLLAFEINNTKTQSKTDCKSTDEARQYFQSIIGSPIYGITNINSLQKDEYTKQINEWREVDVNNLGNKNEILSALLGDAFGASASDMWITLIAFCGYGSHRTVPCQKRNEHPYAYFVND